MDLEGASKRFWTAQKKDQTIIKPSVPDSLLRNPALLSRRRDGDTAAHAIAHGVGRTQRSKMPATQSSKTQIVDDDILKNWE